MGAAAASATAMVLDELACWGGQLREDRVAAHAFPESRGRARMSSLVMELSPHVRENLGMTLAPAPVTNSRYSRSGPRYFPSGFTTTIGYANRSNKDTHSAAYSEACSQF